MTEPFSFKRNYRTIEADEPGLEGFAIRVRAGISNDEHEALVAAYKDLLEYNIAYFQMEPKQRAAADERKDTPSRREWALMAPYIVGWNALGETADGEEKPLPPPAECGPDVFACVPLDAIAWMWRTIIEGYRSTGKAGSLPVKPPPSAGPTLVTKSPDAESRQGRRAS